MLGIAVLVLVVIWRLWRQTQNSPSVKINKRIAHGLRVIRRDGYSKALKEFTDIANHDLYHMTEDEHEVFIPLIKCMIAICYQKKYFYSGNVEDLKMAKESFDRYIPWFPKEKYRGEYFNALMDYGYVFLYYADFGDGKANLLKAIECLNKCIQLRKYHSTRDFVEVSYQTGLCYMKLADMENEKENLEKAVELFRAIAEIKKSRYALSSNISNAKLKIATAYIRMAKAGNKKEMLIRAEEYLIGVDQYYSAQLMKQTFEKNPLNNSILKMNLALCYVEMAKVKETDLYLGKAEKLGRDALDYFNGNNFTAALIVAQINDMLMEICYLRESKP